MSRHMHRTAPVRFLAGLIAFPFALAVAAAHVQAQVPLGPVGNVGLFNPNPSDPGNDLFGSAMTAGDFDGDGIDDLAVADRQHPHLVRVYFGNVWTIGAPVADPFSMATVPVPVTPGSGNAPAQALAAGNFTRDPSHDDELVVGVPGDSANVNQSGTVFVLDRRPEGHWEVAVTIRQGLGNWGGFSETNDHFGASLAVGRFDANDLDDLAIGVPGETTNGQIGSGMIYVVYQGIAGLMDDNEEVFYRGFNGLTGVPGAGEQIGYALAAGDFDGDGIDDLAVGIPGASCAGFANSGSVMVLRGRNDLDGLDAAGVSYWSQAQAGVVDDCETGDRFGAALAAGRFNGTPLGQSPTDDLAAGVPGERVDDVALSGAVHLLYGSDSGVTADANALLHEGLLPGGSVQPAGFGIRLAAGPTSATGGDTLVIGAPLATHDGQAMAGRVWVLPPSTGATLRPERGRAFALSAPYSLGPAQAQDAFGSQFALGDFNGDGDGDLAVGVPGYDAGDEQQGAVQVIYQSGFIFVDGFDG